MKNRIKQASVGDIINFACFVASIILGIISFVIPPVGIIDGSVLMFIAEIGVFSTISKIPDFIEAVKDSHTNLEINKGDTAIKITTDEDK